MHITSHMLHRCTAMHYGRRYTVKSKGKHQDVEHWIM